MTASMESKESNQGDRSSKRIGSQRKLNHIFELR